MLVIAVDYDNTYDEIPDLLEPFMQSAKKAGHVVVIVTARNKDKHPISGLEHEIFYTDGQKKHDYMLEQGLSVDIWIDDYPELIGETRDA